MSATSFKKQSLIKILLLYVLIAVAGGLSIAFTRHMEMIYSFLWADIVMTVVCFIGALVFKNASAYDAYWSVIPFYFILAWTYIFWDLLDFNFLLIAIAVSLWSWRLTINWIRSWPGMDHEDYRYLDLKAKSGKAYPLVNFLGIHMFPTFMVFGCMLPLFWYFKVENKDGSIFLIGFLISILGTFLEWKADNELFRFKKQAIKGQILDTGIWSKVRHPNYLGEMTFWGGVALMGLAFTAPWYAYLGWMALVLMFVFITIPMKEARLAQKPGFDAYQKKVAKIIPRF